jgi:histone H3/H4
MNKYALDFYFLFLIIRMKPIRTDFNSALSDASLTRLARRAGVEAVGGTALFMALRSFISYSMDTILREAIYTVMNVSKDNSQKTLSRDVLTRAITSLNVKLFNGNSNNNSNDNSNYNFTTMLGYKKCKSNKIVDCVSIPKTTFKRLVITEANNYYLAKDIKVPSDASLILQVYIENMTIQLCKTAYLITVNAGRKTLSNKDVTLTRKIARINFV